MKRTEYLKLLLFLVSFKTLFLLFKKDGRYLVTPDARRGLVDVNWTPSSSSSNSSSGILKLEWKDRRTNAVVDSFTIFPEDDCTYSKVDTGNDKDRVYLLQYGVSDRRLFFWMQEKEEGNADEDNCVKINTFMADPAEAVAAVNGEESPSSQAASNAESSNNNNNNDSNTSTSTIAEASGLDSAALMEIMQGINTNGNGNNSQGGDANGGGGAQIDTLSNILENLGIPQTSSSASSATPSNSNTSSTPVPPAAPTAASSGGGLTLADLQGAMAGLATNSPPLQQHQTPGPPLDLIATPDTIIESGILDNVEVKNKLIELLPEGQRTEEKLMENLRSPQVKQCFKSLTAALEEGVSFNSIIANFQLKPEDGAAAMASGNPIQAFLDCVLKSVEREKDEQNNENGEKNHDGDAEMKE